MLWSPNLQLYYPFENQANDYSGNARHGTVFGSGVYATRPNAGRCLYFDGVGDYVQTPSFGLSGTVVVFAADVRCKLQASAIQVLIGDASYANVNGFIQIRRPANSDNLNWYYYNGTVAAVATAVNFFQSPFDDVWVHTCVVCDYGGGFTYFFRDGRLFGSPVAMSGTPVFPSPARVKYVGSNSTTQYLLTDGYMANVQLWTLATMPAVSQMLANVNRLMLGMHPIW